MKKGLRGIFVVMLLVLPMAGRGDDYVDDVYYWEAEDPPRPSHEGGSEKGIETIVADTVWAMPADTVVKMTIKR